MNDIKSALADYWDEQRLLCRQFNAEFTPIEDGTRLGFSIASQDKKPIYGIRHLPHKGTNGWYIWCADKSDAVDFFQPLCAEHLIARCPGALRFLALPPGYGFVADGKYVDVWFDESFRVI